MKTVIARIDLGMTRTAGYLIYFPETLEFVEMTPKEVKQLIKTYGINGLKLVNNEIELDEAFNQRNLMIRTGVGRYRQLYESENMINRMFAVTKHIIDNDGERYEIINNRCGRNEVTSEKLKVLMEIGFVAGVRFKGSNKKIEVCKGVIIEDRRKDKASNIEKNSADTKSNKEQDIKDKADKPLIVAK